jgi:hypothetical protein
MQSSVAMSPTLRNMPYSVPALSTFIYDESQKRDVCNRRIVLDQAKSFVALVLGGVVVSYPSESVAEEHDPFVAMDEAISREILSNNFNDATLINNPSGKKATNFDPRASSKPSQPPSSSVSSTSDLDMALRESKRRKTIDPRTHG